MSFIQREITRINSALISEGENTPEYAKLYAAQQALSWVLEPTGVKSPYDFILGTQEGSEDCSDESRPPQFSDTCVHCVPQ